MVISHKRYFSIIILFSFILFHSSLVFSQCSGSGNIITSGSGKLGNPIVLDPDGDGDIVAGGSTFTGCTDELIEFESLVNPSGCSTCQVPWTPVNNQDADSDLWSSGGCDKTDIIGDDDNGNTFAYFTIVDPDGSCNNGDEIIVFRMRIAGDFSGAFNYGFLVSNEGLTGENDPDGFVCCSKLANAGFEFEVQLKTGGSGAGVNVIDVDGLAGSDNCGGSPDPCLNYTIADNSQKSTACGSVCSCRTSGGDPQFLTFFVPLVDLGVNCNTYTNLTFVPVTSNSPNAVLSNCNSVSDVGGAAELNSIFVSCPSCEGVTYTGCSAAISEQGCALACTAEANSFLTALPVELEFIRGIKQENENLLIWRTSSEINTNYFSIEKSANGRDDFEEIGQIEPKGSEYSGADYKFPDQDLSAIWYYRLKVIDFDGSYEYSNTVAIQRFNEELKILNIYNAQDNTHVIRYVTPKNARNIRLFISDSYGRVLWMQPLIQTGNNQTITIQTSFFPHGVYLFSITNGHKILTERFVI